MSKPMLVGICGAKGAGKNEAAKVLIHRHAFTPIAFADPLKVAVREIFSFTYNQVNGSFEEKEAVDPRWGISPRQAMQWFGTESMRGAFGREAIRAGAWTPEDAAAIWIRVLEHQIKTRLYETTSRIIITDVRFPDEAEWVLKSGGVLLDVWRPGISPPPLNFKTRLMRFLRRRAGTEAHSSEDGPDLRRLHGLYPYRIFRIYNTGGLEELYAQVEEVYRAHFIRAHNDTEDTP